MAAAIQLHRVLLHKARSIRMADPARAERLARLAQRRAQDGEDLKGVFKYSASLMKKHGNCLEANFLL